MFSCYTQAALARLRRISPAYQGPYIRIKTTGCPNSRTVEYEYIEIPMPKEVKYIYDTYTNRLTTQRLK
jgi:hypothetical protein